MKHTITIITLLVAAILFQPASAQFISDPFSSKVKAAGLVNTQVNSEMTTMRALFAATASDIRFFTELPMSGFISSGPIHVVQPSIGISIMSSPFPELPLFYLRGEAGFSQRTFLWGLGATVVNSQIIDASISWRGQSNSVGVDSSVVPKNSGTISTIFFFSPNVSAEYGLVLVPNDRAQHTFGILKKISGFGSIGLGMQVAGNKQPRRFLTITVDV